MSSQNRRCLFLPTAGRQPPTMPEATLLASLFPTVTRPPSLSATLASTSLLTASAQSPWEDTHLQLHTILIMIIFCVVCFLLLLAFFYTFCFHCSIRSWPKDSYRANTCNLEREDATGGHSSSDSQSMGNVVWLEYWTRTADMSLSFSVRHVYFTRLWFLLSGLPPVMIWH